METIRVEELSKSYAKTQALSEVSFTARAGTVLGLLGPNGSGKTTTVRILSTLMRPDSGRAWIDGHDVVAQPHHVRSVIGLTGQYAAVDDELSGQQNLELIARLLGSSRTAARARATELIERFRLEGAARRLAKTYSGGMRRRLDVAASLVGGPRVLFLDEPTTGLDPRSRNEVWTLVRELVGDGVTVLLTTQYLEEADHLANDLVVLDQGRVVATGTPIGLKARVGGLALQVRVEDPDRCAQAAEYVTAATGVEATVDQDTGLIGAPVGDVKALRRLAEQLETADIPFVELGLRQATLDEVFFALTGRNAQSAGPDPVSAGTTERNPR
ncbi:ATP-binding cassette domain-containing protein [Streptomyces sp. SCA3-4]|uniref:ATP-binding cassette domain-containing protein n=1 Tax=Streptomyces sichuanensis TaxID=2871810 RepID=UPI001CE3299F|nr:ATP-binding cassette domain-containing protein [Streptomyces sichuanensis]MCA6094664.1 ATP-binding cassette domain-containing protein [Streptomyces sichuanensis]